VGTRDRSGSWWPTDEPARKSDIVRLTVTKMFSLISTRLFVSNKRGFNSGGSGGGGGGVSIRVDHG
jgi:hypothetical protein